MNAAKLTYTAENGLVFVLTFQCLDLMHFDEAPKDIIELKSQTMADLPVMLFSK